MNNFIAAWLSRTFEGWITFCALEWFSAKHIVAPKKFLETSIPKNSTLSGA